MDCYYRDTQKALDDFMYQGDLLETEVNSLLEEYKLKCEEVIDLESDVEELKQEITSLVTEIETLT
jgi:peptidoglycan hydrolase CwlO-like protein